MTADAVDTRCRISLQQRLMENQFFFCVAFVTSEMYAPHIRTRRGILCYYTRVSLTVYKCRLRPFLRVRSYGVILRKKKKSRKEPYTTGFRRLAAPDIPVELRRYMPPMARYIFYCPHKTSFRADNLDLRFARFSNRHSTARTPKNILYASCFTIVTFNRI